VVAASPRDRDEQEEVPLSKAAQYLLEECRMVLPGIQALFGFQLIAVFNQTFAQKLTGAEQRLHLLAIGLVAVAIALIMAPAAYHRQTAPQHVSSAFIDVSTRLLLWSMLPLAASICVEFYLISRVILNSSYAALPAAVLFLIFVALWFVLPRMRALRKAIARRK
jgi:Family of unknown function (DUF6328)